MARPEEVESESAGPAVIHGTAIGTSHGAFKSGTKPQLRFDVLECEKKPPDSQ